MTAEYVKKGEMSEKRLKKAYVMKREEREKGRTEN